MFFSKRKIQTENAKWLSSNQTKIMLKYLMIMVVRDAYCCIDSFPSEGMMMWRKYSISKGRGEVQHLPLFVFDRKEVGREVYYRVICSHSGREVKEWLPGTLLSKNWQEMVEKYELRCKTVTHLPLESQECEERVLECIVNGSKIIYRFRDRQGAIVEVDSNFFIQFQKLPQLLRFLQQKNYD